MANRKKKEKWICNPCRRGNPVIQVNQEEKGAEEQQTNNEELDLNQWKNA